MEVKDTIDIHRFTVQEEDLNHLGILFGGKLLAKIDSSLAGSVKKYTTELAVTGSVEKVRFIKQLNLGETVTIKSRVSGVKGRVIEVFGEVLNGDNELAAYAVLTFVVLNKSAKLAELSTNGRFEKALLADYDKRSQISSAFHEQIKEELENQDEANL